jgi:hypothetical protein
MNDQNELQPLEIGDSVKVRQGFKDPDTQIDMGGWYGRVTQLFPEEDTAMIAFDSQTLRQMPDHYIETCVADDCSWQAYGYDLADLIKVEPRDTPAEVKAVVDALEAKYIYSYLGEEGLEIRQILRSVDPDDELDHLVAWTDYLEENLRFPFEAVVDEWQERGPLRSGARVRVHAIEDADEHYGIIVKLRHGRKQYHFALCELAAADEQAPEYHLIDLYRTWFANR